MAFWYRAIRIDDLVAGIKDPAIRKRGVARLQKERGKSIAEDIFPKLAEHKGEHQIDPPSPSISTVARRLDPPNSKKPAPKDRLRA